MSSKLSWIRNIFNHWKRGSAAKKRRPYHNEARPRVEQLEVREVLSTLTTAGNIATYTAGAGISSNIDVTSSGTNFVFNDSAETITCSIPGESGSGTNTVTIPIAGVASSGVVLNLGTGDDVIDSSGVQLTVTSPTSDEAPVTINCPGTSLTINGPVTTETKSVTIANTGTGDLALNGAIASNNGNISITSTDNIFANQGINAGSGTISIRANTNASGTAGFSQDGSGSTAITTTSTSSTAVTITVNSANGSSSAGGAGNLSIRNISDSGTLTVNSFGGSILYAGTDTLSGQELGVIGSDNSGSGPTGEVGAKTYKFTTTGADSSIGTAARPIQSDANASTGTITLVAGTGGAYFVDWGDPITIGTGSGTNAAVATGAGNVYVVAANASGHNLTVNGNVSTGSGNIILAADDTLTIDTGAIIGGTADPLGETFSGTVYLGANRDQGNTGTLTDNGTITTANASVFNANTLTPGAVYLEDYSVTGTHAGNLTLGSITVGDGGSITATTDPTLGVYDAAATAGAADIIEGSTNPTLSAGPDGTINLIVQEQSGTTSADVGGIGENGSPILVSAGDVVASVNTATGLTNGVANNSIYISNAIAGNFAAVASGAVAGVINLVDTDTSATGLTINGATSTAGGGTITLIDTSGTNITISASARLNRQRGHRHQRRQRECLLHHPAILLRQRPRHRDCGRPRIPGGRLPQFQRRQPDGQQRGSDRQRRRPGVGRHRHSDRCRPSCRLGHDRADSLDNRHSCRKRQPHAQLNRHLRRER